MNERELQDAIIGLIRRAMDDPVSGIKVVAMEETLEYQIGWLTVVLTKPPLKKPDHG
jgi:hypothetical protein